MATVAFQFDTCVASKVDVTAAIVFDWLQRRSDIEMLLTSKRGVACTDILLLTTFPWLGKNQASLIITKLKNAKLIEVDNADSTLIIPLSTNIKIRKPRLAAVIPADVRQITYTRRDADGSLTETTSTVHELVDEFINQFDILKITPNTEFLYKSKAERRSVESLFDKYGIEKCFDVLNVLPHTNRLEFAPIILGPRDLLYKFPNLLLYIERNNSQIVM